VEYPVKILNVEIAYEPLTTETVHPALYGMLWNLPVTKGWSVLERDRWLTAFWAVADYLYPVINSPSLPPKPEPQHKPGRTTEPGDCPDVALE
jgi:hypothetical protein